MTLPTQRQFPLPDEYEDQEDPSQYIKDLSLTLYEMYDDLVHAVNGNIRSSELSASNQWNPILKGTSTAGSFTYTHSTGWVLRQGILNYCWFDIQWSATGGAAGNLYVELPYLVTQSSQMPYIGPVQPSNITFGSTNTMININAIPGTQRGEFWVSGSGLATSNLAVQSSGRLIGSITYLGVGND